MEKKTNDNYEEFLRGAEYRKTWSIAYFNSLNFAKDMVAFKPPQAPNQSDEDIQKLLIFWRDWAIEQHGKYYVKNIAPVGMQAFSPKVVEGLDKAKEIYADKK